MVINIWLDFFFYLITIAFWRITQAIIAGSKNLLLNPLLDVYFLPFLFPGAAYPKCEAVAVGRSTVGWQWDCGKRGASRQYPPLAEFLLFRDGSVLKSSAFHLLLCSRVTGPIYCAGCRMNHSCGCAVFVKLENLGRDGENRWLDVRNFLKAMIKRSAWMSTRKPTQIYLKHLSKFRSPALWQRG